VGYVLKHLIQAVAVWPNEAAHADTQQEVAAARLLLRAGGLGRSSTGNPRAHLVFYLFKQT
jgi:hypothetical protein